jgi:hypothetical protein
MGDDVVTTQHGQVPWGRILAPESIVERSLALQRGQDEKADLDRQKFIAVDSLSNPPEEICRHEPTLMATLTPRANIGTAPTGLAESPFLAC